jgi:putative sterol carrier protein
MNEQDQGSGLETVTPEQFAQLVAEAENDEQIAETIHSVGTKGTLDRIFEGFEERFLPEKAQGVDAQVLFTIKDESDEYPYTLTISDGTCSAVGERIDSPKTTLTTDLVSFVKLVTGQEDGIKLFMARKLQVAGDLMFAQKIMTFFDRPSAS